MKKCRLCKSEFEPINSLDRYCKWQCALTDVRDKRVKKEKRIFNAETRRRKQSIKTRSDWIKEAQVEFNAFIRSRDSLKGCISCTDTLRDIYTGGQYDAGHYRSRGSAPELRFHEDNCFKQCKKCNRQLSGNVVEMRKGILKRIGQERLDAIEGPHEPKKYTIEELKEIKKHYREKCRRIRG